MGSPTEAEPPVKFPKPAKAFGVRHLQIFMFFLCALVVYAVRVSVSVGIVAMTSPNDYGFAVFDWSKSVQDTVLSSFFWGYLVFQVPAGMMAAKFGGKLLLFVGVLINGLICLIAPVASIYGGWIGMCVCRVGMGLTQGMIYPSLHGLLGKWAPDTERSRLVAFTYAGGPLGTVVEMSVAGFLSASSWGWPSVYYSVGIFCIVWSVAWLFIGANTPSSSKIISQEERDYIESRTGSGKTNQNLPIPWRKIFSSMGFWSILLAHCGQSFGFWTLLTEMPSYMNYILGVDIKSNGLLSALPYLVMFLLSLVFSWFSDWIANRNILSKTGTRKLSNTIAHWGSAVMLLVLCYIPPGNLAVAVAILTLCVGLNGAHYSGYMMVHIDMAPNFASTMMGLTNGISTIFSIMAPLSVSVIIKDETLASEWRKVFFASVGFYFLVNLFFLLFATAELQPWNNPVGWEEDNEKNEKEVEAEKQKI